MNSLKSKNITQFKYLNEGDRFYFLIKNENGTYEHPVCVYKKINDNSACVDGCPSIQKMFYSYTYVLKL